MYTYKSTKRLTAFPEGTLFVYDKRKNTYRPKDKKIIGLDMNYEYRADFVEHPSQYYFEFVSYNPKRFLGIF